MSDRRFYVYVYLDPSQPGRVVIYVGKGCGGRDQSHLAKCNLNDGLAFHTRLKELISQGFDPQPNRLLVSCGEAEANACERYLITKIGREDLLTGPLCNRTKGGGGGTGRKRTPEEVRAREAAKRAQRLRVKKQKARWAAAERQKASYYVHQEAKYQAKMLERHAEHLSSNIQGLNWQVEWEAKQKAGQEAKEKADREELGLAKAEWEALGDERAKAKALRSKRAKKRYREQMRGQKSDATVRRELTAKVKREREATRRGAKMRIKLSLPTEHTLFTA